MGTFKADEPFRSLSKFEGKRFICLRHLALNFFDPMSASSPLRPLLRTAVIRMELVAGSKGSSDSVIFPHRPSPPEATTAFCT